MGSPPGPGAPTSKSLMASNERDGWRPEERVCVPFTLSRRALKGGREEKGKPNPDRYLAELKCAVTTRERSFKGYLVYHRRSFLLYFPGPVAWEAHLVPGHQHLGHGWRASNPVAWKAYLEHLSHGLRSSKGMCGNSGHGSAGLSRYR
jgi:hypothetical protein